MPLLDAPDSRKADLGADQTERDYRQWEYEMEDRSRGGMPVEGPVIVVVSRDEVEEMDTSGVLSALQELTKSPETARTFMERVDIAFHGFDDTPEELFEISEVRSFVHELDRQFPFWLFFLSKQHLGLQCLLLCFLPPFLTDEARSKVFPERINQLLSQRWLPAMNHMCELVGFSEMHIEQLTDRAVRYITTGRLPFDE